MPHVLKADGISIHAPREGSDWMIEMSELVESCISIHAPREGSDVYLDVITLYHI